jgi:alanine racemase
VTRWARAEVDLDAIAGNVAVLRAAAAPAAVWAVVKANGYGHGAVDVATAALAAGAEGLCVALVQEGVELRSAGVEAPVLVLSEQPPEAIPELVAHRLIPTVSTVAYADALAASAVGDQPVHVKVDTGMQRVGCAPADAVGLVAHVRGLAPRLRLEGLFTHLACADEPDRAGNDLQLDVLDEVLDALGPAAPPLVHAANSAGALALPRARRSLVRCGIAVYGISPGHAVDGLVGELRPAMRLVARVSHVKPVAAGSHVSYGWRHRFDRDTTVATVPIGYADGVPRRLGTLPDRPGADVLIGGRRHPIVGVVTMDQLMVDVGTAPVAVGDEVVLIGDQGGDRIRAEDWADRLGTIGYEIVCGIGARVPRVVTRVADRP